MPNIEPKLAIQNAIQDFGRKPLAAAALKLLETLGYNSDKRLVLSPNSGAQFKAEFDPQDRLNVKNARLGEWKSVDFLFQLTGDELQGALSAQGQLFKNQKVDQALIQSYLFFAIELSGAHYNRTDLATITREVNKLFPMPAMLVFKHGITLTFAIIARRMNKRDSSRDVLEKVTLIKDIRIADPHRAHVEILLDLALAELARSHPLTNFVELQRAWEKTLDTAELNKRFYREVANWYFWAVRNVTFPAGTGADEETRNATAVIRLITRLIFVWFIKEKGLVPEDLFDPRRLKEILNYADPQKSTYYKAILQNLFFATLNTEMGADRRFRGKNKNPGGLDGHHGISTVYRYEAWFKDPQSALRLFAGIPFLNGGLFECLDKREEKILVDGFSDDPRNQPTVPDALFFGDEHSEDLSEVYGDARRSHEPVRGLIHIFNSYKFTIEENTPIEEEIALDPELLGKVFENLLAAYNPETGTTARKQTGSFYTPREIVNYMVDEALVAYLESKLESTADVQERLRHLLAYNNEPHQFTEDEAQRLIAAIDMVKVLDPAAGSGAFPMGVLHKLVFILNKLDPGNARWRERQIAKASEIPDPAVRDKVIADIQQAFNENELDYGRKLYLIENCIYGVDIQPIAVQIAKLRFFISLVVEQKTDPAKPNLGIRPLPNLETKFVAANTLIGIERPQQMMLRNPEIDKKERDLANVRSSMFTAKTPATKRKYRDLDKQLRTELAGLLKKDGWGSAAAAQLAGWDPYDQNASAGFFDPGWMFGINNGFDVIIGNPPYLESRHPAFSDKLKLAYQEAVKRRWLTDAKYITKGTDLLIYFFENSIYNVSKNGCIVFITQNSWLDTEYGKKFQQFLLRHTLVKKVVDSDFRYFPSGEGPNINAVITLFLGKTPNPENVVKFARYHENFQQTDIASLNLSSQVDSRVVTVQRYKYSNTLLHEMKWGILLTATNDILRLFGILNNKAQKLSDLKGVNLSYGQGLNLSREYFVSREDFYGLRVNNGAAIPILTIEDGAVFDISKTAQVIIDKTKLSGPEIQKVKSQGIALFDPNSTNKKPPKLIMPRGIGRHYCAISSISSYSSSGVDIYDNQNSAPENVILNLWLFFNSSIAWLLREISGRKNLGGGMLKSEAVDLETMPVYMDFKSSLEIKAILKKLQSRQALPTLDEIFTIEHQEIDKIVFDHLELEQSQREDVLDALMTKISDREKKSTTSVKQIITNIADQEKDADIFFEDLNPIQSMNSPITQSFAETSVAPGDYGLYKCGICGQLVTGFMKEDHAREKHPRETVEWKKMGG